VGEVKPARRVPGTAQKGGKVIVTILDTVTGEKRTTTDDDWSGYFWSEGNGSCDCNRAREFGIVSGCGSNRFLIVGVSGTIEEEYLYNDMNSNYPDELKEKFLPGEMAK